MTQSLEGEGRVVGRVGGGKACEEQRVDFDVLRTKNEMGMK
jgi:hypothetical protein